MDNICSRTCNSSIRLLSMLLTVLISILWTRFESGSKERTLYTRLLVCATLTLAYPKYYAYYMLLTCKITLLL